MSKKKSLLIKMITTVILMLCLASINKVVYGSDIADTGIPDLGTLANYSATSEETDASGNATYIGEYGFEYRTYGGLRTEWAISRHKPRNCTSLVVR